ncbi:hypothetical protein ACFL59_12100, partial [Planctomycetota bacterium]
VADTVDVAYEEAHTALDILDRIGEKEPAIAERMVRCLAFFDGDAPGGEAAKSGKVSERRTMVFKKLKGELISHGYEAVERE